MIIYFLLMHFLLFSNFFYLSIETKINEMILLMILVAMMEVYLMMEMAF
jgi:hypothetical protein